MLNWVISVLSFCLLMGGSFAESATPCHVVTAIDIQWEEDGTPQHRLYTQQDKMNKVLYYLHALHPMPQTQESEEVPAPEYRIVLQLSDGSKVQYTQRGTTNFRKEAENWSVVDPEDAIRLPLILAAVSSDFQ